MELLIGHDVCANCQQPVIVMIRLDRLGIDMSICHRCGCHTLSGEAIWWPATVFQWKR